MNAEEARTRLETLLGELDRSAAVLSGEVAEGLENSEDTQRQTDQDASDSARNLVDNDREEASIEVVEAQRTRVREALERIAAGSYGKCIDCGKDIPAARLEAKPEVERCVEDQQKFEASR